LLVLSSPLLRFSPHVWSLEWISRSTGFGTDARTKRSNF
jgi:hypothetical protein